MGGYGDVQMIDENGLRVDGRGPADIRPVSIETGVIPVADGSARVIWGTNHAVAAVRPDGGPSEKDPASGPSGTRRTLQHGTVLHYRPNEARLQPTQSGNQQGHSRCARERRAPRDVSSVEDSDRD